MALALVSPSDASNDPSNASQEHRDMSKDWTLISDIIAGSERIRSKSITYLPQYEDEIHSEYQRRLLCAPWRPEFTDILRTLASKPFGKEVALKGTPADDIAGRVDTTTNERSGGIVDDIDGRGNGLTVFAREWFGQGIAKGLHAVLVDYPTMRENATVAEERAAGARPYWVHVPADNIKALYTEIENGREIISHIRISECIVRRNGFSETKVEQIRVFEPGYWAVYEKDEAGKLTKVDEGKLNRGGKTSVPIVLYFTGERLGDMAVRPPLADLAHMQIELYRALSREDEVLTYAGSPMLSANGMAPPSDGSPTPVGPKRIMWAPPGLGENSRTSWDFIQPAAENIAEVRKHIASIQLDMRRIGMQPMTESPGSVTATGMSIDAAKAHSAVKAWALMLNDAIEQAFVFTCEWMGINQSVETEVSTDFSVLPYAAEPIKALLAMRGTKDITRDTLWDGMRRFDVLPPDFDPREENKALQTEAIDLAKRQVEGEAETPLPTEEQVRVNV